jgi:hypothetical protein
MKVVPEWREGFHDKWKFHAVDTLFGNLYEIGYRRKVVASWRSQEAI